MNNSSQNFFPQLIIPVATLAGLVVAYFLGSAVAKEDYFRLIATGVGIVVIWWAIFGRAIWWLPMFFFPALGGLFYVGFKIYVHELALMLSLLPLVLLFALNRSEIAARKHNLQGLVLLLILYLCFHLLACLTYLKVYGLPGTGNVLRRYADAMWPMMFLVAFLFFGKTKHLRWGMHLMLFATVVRFALGLYSFYTADGSEGSTMFIPLINFVPAGANSSEDLRASGPVLIALAISYFCIHRNIFLRIAMLNLIVLGCWGTFLGASRLTLVSAFLLIAFPLIIYRRLAVLSLCSISLFVAIMYINVSPDSLYGLPDSARRAATGLLLDRKLAAETGTTQRSDEFHFRLMSEGWKSWTSSPLTIFFGRGTSAFDERSTMGSGLSDFEARVEMAIATSRFEKGLWDTLCTFGIFGMALFLGCMVIAIRGCLRALTRDKISTYAHGLAFFGAFQCISWLLLCWIGGSFPSSAIMTALIALIAIQDESARKAAAPIPQPSSEPKPETPRAFSRPVMPMRR